MLVLTRKVMEKIQIGNDITLVVLRLTDGKVRIGIDAPDNVRIIRSEIDNEPRKEDKR